MLLKPGSVPDFLQYDDRPTKYRDPHQAKKHSDEIVDKQGKKLRATRKLKLCTVETIGCNLINPRFLPLRLK